MVIRFQYRELTEEEVKKYDVAGGSNTSKQQKVNEFSFNSIINEVAKINKEVSLYLQKDKKKPLYLSTIWAGLPERIRGIILFIKI